MTPFDAITAAANPAMIVVTTASDGERAGCLVGFHAQCSINPRRYSVWLSKANHTYRVGLTAQRFALHWLAEGDESIAEHFGSRTGDAEDKFATVEWSDAGDGLPVIDAVANRILTRRHALLDDGGDHVCLVLDLQEVVAAEDFRPLRFTAVRDLDPGHPAEDF